MKLIIKLLIHYSLKKKINQYNNFLKNYEEFEEYLIPIIKVPNISIIFMIEDYLNIIDLEILKIYKHIKSENYKICRKCGDFGNIELTTYITKTKNFYGNDQGEICVECFKFKKCKFCKNHLDENFMYCSSCVFINV